jgi:hypothetical protein
VKIDGLQVGDVLDMSYTIRRNDPLFKNRFDQVTAIQDLIPVRYNRIRMSWPAADNVRWRATEGMPQPRGASEGGVTTAEIIAENVTPLIKPQGAPPRFQRGREFSVRNYRDWAAVSGAMAPLFSAPAELQPNSPLKAEAAIHNVARQPPSRWCRIKSAIWPRPWVKAAISRPRWTTHVHGDTVTAKPSQRCCWP